LVELQ
jgi:hypothetical protein